MGFALARHAARKGANVWLVAGPNNLKTPFGVHRVDVKTADEMLEAAARYFHDADVVFAVAAVEDLKPERVSEQKIKKGGRYQIECSNAVDVLQSLANKKRDNQILIGFSVETENEIEHSREKLRKKSLDAIVVNNPREEGAAFQHDTNKVTVLTGTGVVKNYSLMSKDELASELLEFT
ncbi:MAG: phosphopantothenoylcysteine decarboxylase, partial [candidate division Zixibacteria bacterium]|nr:phosphopantothenoylcysteine decarboxylase [Gammaproteobacteria bacterium]NIR50513.1 phosphopantothenoylcysteine decarboxylase [candidate division KSB1 bacterium]NIS47372.1 phosphopantothenoylcysteine decarboxylase [candidate division Zixibacteria bacterium]NIT72836.1 phosphopantothenoylcysteine decarboxylase [candidate division KSB1 bacterium]NIV07580.1 phosphopantothenoylcysteine decarboxylase [candidate division Zixibacteria bacterium]